MMQKYDLISTFKKIQTIGSVLSCLQSTINQKEIYTKPPKWASETIHALSTNISLI